MDVRWLLCLVYTTTTMTLSGCYLPLQGAVGQQEDNLTADSIHNYTNLKIFLWSGSGDGSDESTKSPTTTTAIPFYSEDPEDCIGGHDCNIKPTTIAPHPGVIDIPQTVETPGKEYWTVTELNFHSSFDANVFVREMKEKLVVLYTLAFTRQQARHLGLYANWTEEDDAAHLYRNRRWEAGDEKPIRVGVHILSVANLVDLVYFVTADNRPVSAETAVRDMGLVTTKEVADRLGCAVRIKARPYLDRLLHSEKTLGSSRGEIFILVSAACAVALILVTGVAVIAHKKKIRKNTVRSDRTNMAASRGDRTPPRRDVKTEATSTEDMVSATRTPEPKPRKKNKISDSLLSMQVANKFQKDLIPGPLTNVLDGLNENKNGHKLTRHESICGQDSGVIGPIVWDLHCKRMKIKNNDQDDGSCSSSDAFNAMDTNVTKMRQKFHELLDDAFTLFGSRNSSSRSDDSSPSMSNNEQRSKSAPFRSSATSGGCSAGRPKTSVDSGATTGNDDERLAAAGSSCWVLPPGEAWAGSDQSVFVPRPLSAGPFHRPNLRAEFISSDASLSPRDPAVPLIRAIRQELDRLPTPDPLPPRHRGRDSSRR